MSYNSEVLKSFGIAFAVSTALLTVPISDAVAFHETNKWERRENLENGWVVFYSKEISHAEMLKIAAAIAADSTVSGGGATSAYFSNFAKESLAKLLNEAGRKSPQTFRVLRDNLTVKQLLSSIRGSFNGKELGLNIAGLNIRVGRETYNRAECLKIFGKKKCSPTPNTYEPYIRIKK